LAVFDSSHVDQDVSRIAGSTTRPLPGKTVIDRTTICQTRSFALHGFCRFPNYNHCGRCNRVLDTQCPFDGRGQGVQGSGKHNVSCPSIRTSSRKVIANKSHERTVASRFDFAASHVLPRSTTFAMLAPFLLLPGCGRRPLPGFCIAVLRVSWFYNSLADARRLSVSGDRPACSLETSTVSGFCASIKHWMKAGVACNLPPIFVARSFTRRSPAFMP